MDTFDYEEAFHQYIQAALWSSSCNGTARAAHDCRGQDCDTPLEDLYYNPCDIHPESLVQMSKDLEDFVDGCLEEDPDVFDGIEAGQVGHDFWLTRNHHGTGFWDRGLGERGRWLTERSHPYGEASLYVDTHDNKVYYQN